MGTERGGRGRGVERSQDEDLMEGVSKVGEMEVRVGDEEGD